MRSREIRDGFFAFFADRGHEVVPSASLVPNDPTLLLTNAGMNQFKPYFLGEQTPPFLRAVSSQKCMRAGGKHNDLDQVGRTARHLTFFEMLGNFSFGDYYKEQACPFAWELVTEVYGLDPDRLWVTVFETDDEAFGIWRDVVGVDPGRIIRMGKKDNFWSMGVAGPCGPCSEIAVDMGDAFGPPSDDGPKGNEDRYLEIWNLVFMENDCNAQIEPVAELPKKNIDTGAGLERLAMVLQGADTVFETDILSGMIDRAAEMTGVRYGDDAVADVGLRILADHGRSVSFMLADGILPSNEERGYVLRLIMRRAIRHARLLGRQGPILDGLIDATIDLMGDAYPELKDRRDVAIEVASREEERFDETLKQGMTMLEQEIAGIRGTGGSTLPGEIAFRLHDTWGFPIDITTEIAMEAGLDVDRPAFEDLMEAQRQRARAARRGDEEGVAADAALAAVDSAGPSEFLGYEHLACTARVVAITNQGVAAPVAQEGEECDVVLDRTVFYPEGGGQVGDRGSIRSSSGHAAVRDVQRLAPGLIVHRCAVAAGELRVDDEVEAIVDAGWRHGSEQAHTATHILHWVLRDQLGDHARQAGSLVEPGRLRFDFSHFDRLDDERIAEISSDLQGRVFDDDHVTAYETSYEFARSIGAMAIFGERYGDVVRVVEVGEYSKELCGGTHVPHTSRIGAIVVTGESSVGANLRRVEALVGAEGLAHLERRSRALERAADLLKTEPHLVEERLERLLTAHKELERRLEEVERRSSREEIAQMVEQAERFGDALLVVARRDIGVDSLRAMAQQLKGRGSVVAILGTAADGKANLVSAVSKDLVEAGVSARDLLVRGAEILGGGAGGKPDLAISGGRAAERLDEALDAAAQTARAALRR